MTAREDLSRSTAEIPVLIIGGGLVGLSTAMFLAQHGVASVVAERLLGVAAPRIFTCAPWNCFVLQA
jgi:2-polyprenyl-6-methoxyphenol hydroxylase-like FAD-dependent oxidoreductase